MNFSKLRAVYALLTGGIGGILKYFVNIINTQLFEKIKDKETAIKYLKDTKALYVFIRTILETHGNSISERRKIAIEAVLDAIEELTKAFEDFKVEDTEIDGIIEKIKAAIDALKKNK